VAEEMCLAGDHDFLTGTGINREKLERRSHVDLDGLSVYRDGQHGQRKQHEHGQHTSANN